MDECYRGHPNPLPSREPGQIPRQPQPPAGGVGGSVTQRARGKVCGMGRGASGVNVPSAPEEVGGRKRICLPGRHNVNMGAAHLKCRNTPILILILFFLQQGPSLSFSR